MKPFPRILRIALIVLTIFMALTTVAGGIQLVEGTYAPPTEMLSDSVFNNFIIPGLILGVIVGGSAAFAALGLIRKSKFAFLFAASAGIIIMFFEFVEVMVIGSPPGVARTLQIFYFGLGTLIMILSLGAWFLDLLEQSPS
jgi:hypothetical protein